MDQTQPAQIQQTQDLFADASAGEPGAALPAAGGSMRQEPSGGAEAPQDALGDPAQGPVRSDGPAVGVISRAEFNKVVGQRQTAKEKVRQLTAQVDQLLARLSRPDEQDEGRTLPDSKADSQATDLQAIEERLPDPVKAHIEDLRGRKETLENRLADLLADQELRVAAARARAINPDQVVALLRDRVRMIETATGRFEAHFLAHDGQAALDGDKPIRDAQRFVETFLAMPENTNLVRSTVTPGSGARQAGGAMTHMDPTPQSKAEFLALPPSQRLTVANRMTRQQRDSILGRGSADEGGYI